MKRLAEVSIGIWNTSGIWNNKENSALVSIRALTLFFVIIAVNSFGSAAEDELFNKFENPPAEAKPFVRWWWGDNSVEEKEILREIGVFDKAGIGGYEINPIALPVETELSSPSLEWLSPEFNRMVKVAVDETNKRGMIADLIVGSGWPFGAEFLEPGEMTKRFYVKSISVKGPKTFSKSLNELKVPVRSRKPYKFTLEPECHFVYLAPADISDISQCIEISKKISDNKLIVKIPAGKHYIHVGLSQEGFNRVYGGSPGAKGPVLDHYNSEAVRHFLNRMSGKLGPALGGKMGSKIRAIFCDSIELSAANWTTDMAEVFKNRYGYDLMPYLPFIVKRRPITGDDSWSEKLKRVRYDYSKLLVDMFQERFIKVYHEWCHDNECLSRYQAYGLPWLMGLLDSYLIPDIPETNNWLFRNPDKHGFLVWTKYCSSAGHIKDRRIISSEAMTNTTDVFKSTLDLIKTEDDMNFIMGVNHSVLHGYTYSPLEEGPYARIRFGAYFSEQNTWWPYFKYWTEYNARLSAVFQNTKPVVSIAILGPRSDIWKEYGLERPPFHEKPWYLPQLWKVFSNCGSSADHVNEPVLQRASAVDGKLKCGEMKYEVLIVAGAESLEPETAEVLKQLADAGVKIVFIDKIPDHAPSLKDMGAGDALVKKAVAAMLSESDNVFKVDAPEKAVLYSWTDKLLKRLDIKRDIKVDGLYPNFYQIRKRKGKRDLFFLVNRDGEKPLAINAEFNTKGRTAWHWNPETGKRSVYASPVSGPMNITLAPHGSILLVFEPGTEGNVSPPAEKKEADKKIVINGKWDCKFIPAREEAFRKTNFELVDLGKSKDKKLNTFAGVIEYKKNFKIDNTDEISKLDLGEVNGVSEAILNGKPVGVRWYGNHVYDISNAVRTGKNELEVKVTTVLYNYTRTLSKKTSAGYWTRGKGTVAAGLEGPVVLR